MATKKTSAAPPAKREPKNPDIREARAKLKELKAAYDEQTKTLRRLILEARLKELE